MDAIRTISEADGLSSLGLHLDAWDVLETFPAADRMRPEVLRVRLMICTGLERWELGSEVSRCIGPSHSLPQREATGRFHLAHAISLCAAGNTASALGAVESLSEVWPEGRMLALDCLALERIW